MTAALRYRPLEFDDWGIIRRGDSNEIFAVVRRPLPEEDAARHREAGTDPFEPLARALMSAVQPAALTYDWNGHTDMPILHAEYSDAQVAGVVRMLMRDQLDHEVVCVMARDRIMALSKALYAHKDVGASS